MASLSPVSHRELVRRLRKIGFDGPFAEGSTRKRVPFPCASSYALTQLGGVATEAAASRATKVARSRG